MARMRVASSRERYTHGGAELDAYARACRAFFERELADEKSFVRSWVATSGGRIVGGASLTVLPTFPRSTSPEVNVDGRVRDVYVEPGYRRRGVARALMDAVIADARALGIERLTLGASAMGAPLYEGLGFVRKPDEMVYDV